MNGIGKCSGLRTEPQRKEQKWEVMGEWMRVRKKINGVGGGSRLRTDPQIKEQKWEVMGSRDEDKEENEWRREKKRTADGSAKKGTGGGDGAESSHEGAKIRRVLEDEKKQDKTSTKVYG